MTLLSCHLLYETVLMTGLSSMPELAYFLGGGRAAIFWVSFALVSFYLSLPSQYLRKSLP